MGTNLRKSEMTMRVMISVLTGAAALGLVPLLGAQEKSPSRKAPPSVKSEAPERDGCVTTDGRTECIFRRRDMDSVMTKRAVLGVQLSPTGTMRDTLGVFVSRVTPGGPAEKAGIVEGDRIVSINGVDLRVNAADAGDSYAADLPSRRLTREVGKLTPGNVANLRVYSGGRTRDLPVTLGRASDFREEGFFGSMPNVWPGGGVRVFPDMDGVRTHIRAMPGIRMEQMDLPRLRREMDGLRDRIRVESLAPLRDGKFRLLAPSLREDGIRIERMDPVDGKRRFRIIVPDDVIIERIDKQKEEKKEPAKVKK